MIEIYDGDTIQFMVPLAKQDEFYVPEIKDLSDSEEEEDEETENAGGDSEMKQSDTDKSSKVKLAQININLHLIVEVTMFLSFEISIQNCNGKCQSNYDLRVFSKVVSLNA